jgi:peptidoglycan L-alanyl-D-glutamate endopeptidase CwlK
MKDKISEERISHLHPKLREEVKQLIEKAESIVDDNLAIRVVQGLRTIEEQNDLYAQGRTKPGSIVTNAKGGSSYHNFGLAFDFAFLFKQPDGTYKYDDAKSWLVGPNHKKVTDLFKSHNYQWGGDWKSSKDFPHLEKNFGISWRDLKSKYDKKDFIPNTQYVNI